MTLKNQRLLIILASTLIISIPIAFVVKWSFEHKDSDVNTNNDQQYINQITNQLQTWNPGAQNIIANSLISSFMPHDVDEQLLSGHADDVFEYRSLNNTTKYPEKMYDEPSTSRVTIHDPSSIKAGTKIEYKINEKHNMRGEVTLDLIVSHKNLSQKVTIPVRGFQTSDQKSQNDVTFAKNLIYRKLSCDPNDDLEKVLPPSEYNLVLKLKDDSELKSQLPSELTAKITGDLDTKEFHILGLNPPTKAERDEYTNFDVHTADVRYAITAFDDEEGSITITAYISKESYHDTLDIILTGFRNELQEDEKVLQDLIKTIAREQTTILNNFYPTWDVETEEVNSFKLGIEEIKLQGGKVKYKLLNIDQDEGIIKVKVELQKGQANRDVEITITGYRTRWKYEVDETLKKIYDQVTTKINDLPPGKKDDEVDFEQLGIKPVEVPYEIKITYKIININKVEGEVDIDVDVKNQGAHGNKIITVRGFKSYEQIIDKIKPRIQDVTLKPNNSLKNQLPSEVKTQFGDKLSEDHLSKLDVEKIDKITQDIAKLSYTIVEVNDELGEMKVLVKVTIKNFSIKETFMIKGFETKNQRDEKTLTEFYQKFLDTNNIDEHSKIIHLVSNSSYTTKLASKVGIQISKLIKPNQTRNLNIIIPDKYPNVKTEIIPVEINDQTGSITFNVKIVLGDKYKQITIKVQGFRLKEEQDKLDIQNLKFYLEDQYKDVKIVDDSPYRQKLPSEVKQIFGLENLTEKHLKELNITVFGPKILKESIVHYKIFSVNDGSGQISIQVTISQGKKTDNFMFQIKGFQTQNERNENVVHQVLDKFKQDNPNPRVLPDSDLARKTLQELGYKVNDFFPIPENAEKLNIVLFPDDLEIVWEFKIQAIDNKNGIITIEVIVEKGFATAKGEISITGFKIPD